jgi:hypothetical protein
VLVAAVAAAVLLAGGGIGLWVALRGTPAAENEAGPSNAPVETPGPSAPETPSPSAPSPSESPVADPSAQAYCAEVDAFVQEWEASGEHSDPADVAELIAAYQKVADKSVPATRGLWDELLAAYRAAQDLVEDGRALTADEEAELDRLNGEITRLATVIDEQNAVICANARPSEGA